MYRALRTHKASLVKVVVVAAATGVMALGTASAALADGPGDRHGRSVPVEPVTVVSTPVVPDYQSYVSTQMGAYTQTTASSAAQDEVERLKAELQAREEESKRLRQAIAELEQKLKEAQEQLAQQEGPCLPEGYEFLADLPAGQQQEFADMLRGNKRKWGNYQGICGTGIMGMTPEQFAAFQERERQLEQWLNGLDQQNNTPAPSQPQDNKSGQAPSQDPSGPSVGSVVKGTAKDVIGYGAGKASEMLDEAIETVGHQAATQGWYDDATRRSLTKAGAASKGLSTISRGLTGVGIAGGIYRAASTDDPAEQTRGALDAVWSAVPGPHGLAGSIGNAIGQEIEKIDTGVKTAQGGSTVHDWLTAAMQEYVDNGFWNTFVGGWKDILRIR